MKKVILMTLTIITAVTMVTSSSSVLAEDNSAIIELALIMQRNFRNVRLKFSPISTSVSAKFSKCKAVCKPQMICKPYELAGLMGTKNATIEAMITPRVCCTDCLIRSDCFL